MSFDLQSGLLISSGLISLAILMLWAYLIYKKFEIALSLMIVGSFLIQYTKINLLGSTISLILPATIIIIPYFLQNFFEVFSKLSKTEKRIFLIILLYFTFLELNAFTNSHSIFNFLGSFLLNIARRWIPFAGVFYLLKNNSKLLIHIKTNAYLSLGICIGYILVVFTSGIYFKEISDVRSLSFWNMNIGSFSSLALWSLFYYFTYVLLVGFSNKFSSLILVLPLVVIILSQSRGLLLSVLGGLFAIVIVSKHVFKSLLTSTVISIILLFVISYFKLDIANQKTSYYDIYTDRFSESSAVRTIETDTRYTLWVESLESIIENPFGGGSIKEKMGVHSMYLEILMQFGIFSFLLIIAGFILVIKLLKNIKKKIQIIKNPELLIITGSTIGILSHAFIGGILGGVEIFLYWSLAMLIVLGKKINYEINYWRQNRDISK